MVRKVLSNADKPASKHCNADDGATLLAKTFDPIIMEVIEACNKEWTGIFHVQGTTWVSFDDDKLLYISILTCSLQGIPT